MLNSIVLSKTDSIESRLDKQLAKLVSSRQVAIKLIKSGLVAVNGKIETDCDYNPKIFDKIEFTNLPVEKLNLNPIAFPLEIHYEDSDIIVVYKPADVITHPGAGNKNKTFLNYLLHQTNLANNSEQRPGVVHRLDKNTSGLMVFAKNINSLNILAKEFATKTAKRQYLAFVYGNPVIKSGTIETLIGRSPNNRKKMAVLNSGGKKAITNWQVVAAKNNLAIIKCALLTGRTHQIRVHLAHIGMPILADDTYAPSSISKTTAILAQLNLVQAPRQYLHSFYLKIQHPISNQTLEFKRQLPADLKMLADIFNLDDQFLYSTI